MTNKVACDLEYDEVEGDYGSMDGVRVTCRKCQHSTESCGEGDGSIYRCLALLREECPLNEKNHYSIRIDQ